MKIVLDSVFFQFGRGGIARVWMSLLEEWVRSGFHKHLIMLDRGGVAPKFPGIKYILVHSYNYKFNSLESRKLQKLCDDVNADLFFSTYYTTPLSTPSSLLVHDMIPEVLGANLSIPMWKEKHRAIRYASSYITVSNNTAKDLTRFFPHIPLSCINTAYCGVSSLFSPATYDEICLFKKKYEIAKPYFLLVGARGGHKNTDLIFKAFSQLHNKSDFDIVCIGGQSTLNTSQNRYIPNINIRLLKLNDYELKLAYSGAVSLIYPSKYEGFGLPIVEAMSCGCPVITCRNSSIVEVAGSSALYVSESNYSELVKAIYDIQKPHIRNSLISKGISQSKQFSWDQMAKIISSVLTKTVIFKNRNVGFRDQTLDVTDYSLSQNGEIQ